MSTVYTQKIFSIEVIPNDGDLENVVIRVQWEYRARDGANAAWTVHTTELDSIADTENFVSFSKLTEELVLGWITAKEDMVALKQALDTNLQAVINTPSKQKLPPWEALDENIFSKNYVLVSNGEVIWGPKRWDTFTINRVLLQNGINETVPNVVPIVPENEPTQIDDTTYIYQVSSYDQLPSYDIFEELDEPFWDFSTGKAVINRFVSEVSLEKSKQILSQEAKMKLLYSNFYIGTKNEKSFAINGAEIGEILVSYNNMSEDSTFVWRSTDDNKLEFNKEEVELFLTNATTYFQNNRLRYFDIVDSISSANSVQEVHNIYSGI